LTFAPKIASASFHLPDFLAIQVDYVDDRHNLFSLFTLSEAKCRSVLLRFPGFADKNVTFRSAPAPIPAPAAGFRLVSTFTYFQILRRYPRIPHVTRKVLVFPDA